MKLQSDLSQWEHLPPIELHVAGDLQVRGWAERSIQAQTDDEEPNFKQDEGGISIHTQGDLIIDLPTGSNLSIGSGGDASVQHLQGNLVIEGVGGNLAAKEVPHLEVKHVGGDLHVHRAEAVSCRRVGGNAVLEAVEGGVSMGKVGGDANVQGVQGMVELEHVGGNLVTREVKGLQADRVGGDLHVHGAESVSCRRAGGNAVLVDVAGAIAVNAMGDLHISDSGGDVVGNAHGNAVVEGIQGSVRLNAQGDIRCKLADGIGATVRVVCAGELLIQGGDEHARTHGRGVHSFSIGEGNSSLTLVAAGSVHITGTEPLGDLHSVGEDFTAFGEEMGRFGEEMGKLGEEMGKLGEEMGHEFGSLGYKIAQKINDKLQRKLERSLRKASAKAARAARSQRWSFDFQAPVPPRPPVPPLRGEPPNSEPVTEEERLMILRMVEDGKISAGEAEKLLAALEGNYEA